MAQKTRQSYSKRIKVTRSGKLITRKAGQGHFNAKMSRKKQLDQKRSNKMIMKNRTFRTNMPHQKRRTPNKP